VYLSLYLHICINLSCRSVFSRRCRACSTVAQSCNLPLCECVMIDVPTGLLELPLTMLIKLATRSDLWAKYEENFCRVPEHSNCQGCFIAYEACRCQECRVFFSPANQLNLIWKKSLEYLTAASEQALHLLTVFVHTRKYRSILATRVEW